MFEHSEKLFWKDLRNRFPTLHGEQIDTVRKQTGAAVRINVGIRLPTHLGSG